MKKSILIIAALAVCGILAAVILFSGRVTVSFSADICPGIEGVTSQLSINRAKSALDKSTEVWKLEVVAVNTTDQPQDFKLALNACPRIKDCSGSRYGTIPGCTVSENGKRAFSLFASDRDQHSVSGTGSLERQEDGSFRHSLCWEGTLLPGETYKVTAFACEGKPRYENYGFSTVFPVAWELLEHNTPAQRTVDEVIGLDLACLGTSLEEFQNSAPAVCREFRKEDLSHIFLYNPPYGPDLDFSRYNWRPAGAFLCGTEQQGELNDSGVLLIPGLFELSKTEGNNLWREVAALVWRNATQGFADEDRSFWHGKQRAKGSKNESWFPDGEKKGCFDDKLESEERVRARLACILSLPKEDREYLDSVSRPCTGITLENEFGRALVDVRGANLRVWKSAEHPERRILGSMGIPVYWPWAVYEGHPGCNIHGLTPYLDWEVAASDSSSVTLTLDDSGCTRLIWPHKFHAEMTYRLGKTVKAEFRVTNTDDHSYTCTELLHPFFHVSDPFNCHFEGLDGSKYFWKKEAEMGADRVWNGDFPVGKIAGGNPGIVFETGEGSYSLVDGNNKVTVHFTGGIKFVGYVSDEGAVAMETGTLYRDRAYTLNPGETHRTTAEISL